MKVLFVHERWGAFGGAESNVLVTASELQRRGHTIGIIHGPSTGRAEERWSETFTHRFPLAENGSDNEARVSAAVGVFQPDTVYVHKTADLGALRSLTQCGAPLVRMVHDHDLYCMRSYKYRYVSRRPCLRAASPW